jgi:tryptophanyl-tRNA synthetase
MSIVTDSRRPEDPKDPDIDRVFALYRHIADEYDVTRLAARYRSGDIGYAEAKELLVAAFEARFGSARGRFDALLAAPDELEEMLAEGARRARRSAAITLKAVREATGLHDNGFESDR